MERYSGPFASRHVGAAQTVHHFNINMGLKLYLTEYAFKFKCIRGSDLTFIMRSNQAAFVA